MKIVKTYDSMSLLKGIGAIIVCSSHALDLFVWRNFNKPIMWEEYLTKPVIWYLLWSGGLQVSIFCLISGFFAWNKEVADIKTLIISLIKRYTNFVTMIFCSDLIMYILKVLNIMPLEDGGRHLANSEMPYMHQVYFFDMMINSFKLKNSINGALWMIKPLFLGNCLIYILKYLKRHLGNYVYFLYIVMLFSALFVDNVVFVTISGVMLYEMMLHLPEVKIDRSRRIVLVIWIIAMMYLAQNPLGLGGKVYNMYILGVCVVICIVVFYAIHDVEMPSSIVKYLKNESIAIYCIHISVIYSLGLYTYIALDGGLCGENMLIMSAYIVSMISTLVLACVYHNTVEKIRMGSVDFCAGVIGKLVR